MAGSSTTPQPVSDRVLALARAAKSASRVLATLPTAVKDQVLRDVADAITNARDHVLRASAADVSGARDAGLPGAKLRRLELTSASLAQLRQGLRQVADLPDPVGQQTAERTTPAGVRVRRVRSPLGVIAMIYESRPGVTIDAFALCFKSGNACILKGGREAAGAAGALAEIAQDVLARHGIPAGAMCPASDLSREQVRELLALEGMIDLAIPRGGPELIRAVREVARVPVVFHAQGVCHIYVDAALDGPDMTPQRAVEICVSAKANAPATCNAVECVLVHADAAARVLPPLMRACAQAGVVVRAQPRALAHMQGATLAEPSDFGREFLDMVLAVKVVDGLEEAIAHIHAHGSDHTESILTCDPAAAQRFQRDVASSVVVVNGSTRLNDGFRMGLGAEIGISTTRVHAYGPMGLEELTCQRYLVDATASDLMP